MDVQLHYTEQGSGEPLVLLHGNGEDSSYFEHQLDCFQDRYRVIAVDSRAHGGSPRGMAPLTLAQFAEDLAAFMDELGIASAHILGFSDGANVAMLFAVATATIPDILVVDEALSVGDFRFQEKCEARINELVEEHGTTLLFVSHSIEQVERVCTKAIWIEKSKMRMIGDAEEVCEAYRSM